MSAASAHQPVLLKEAVDALTVQAGGIYLDGTFGRGGHSREILKRLGAEGKLLVLDRDPEAHAAALALAERDPRVAVHRAAFSGLERIATEVGVSGRVNGVLLDIGVSSAQLDDPRRGFSFTRSGPLDMRMDPESGESAAAWLMRAPEQDIAAVIHEYGEERHARRIAKAIVSERVTNPITDTLQLAEIVSRAVPRHDRFKHPATRSFQAIRIFINRELEELGSCLQQCLKVLAPAGRLAVISFHSLEDRMVKRFMRDQSRLPAPDPKAPWLEPEGKPLLRVVGKVVQAGEAEVAENPRARSAVLRVAEKLP
ncbi:MAG TPA: 16S rRNA (cytosine(1402)-N(4))-methyltransferase RsmH [Gammaproteobacteria bacterium]|nr:16S rRNA (cytosine(1402)-N(4))-methyltransferase RsmH [Gammaproteobacteria bacterium]